MNEQTVGILSIATYIPPNRMSGEEIAKKSGIPADIVKEKMGIESIAIPGENDHPVGMGIEAAKKALANSDLKGEDIDLIIYVGEEYKEYPVWTGATHIQHKLGAKNAWGFDVSLRCGTSVMAMKVAKALMVANEDIHTVLLAGGYRNSDLIDFSNMRTRFMFNLASGGGACILQKGLKKNEVLETEIITDGRFSEDVLVKVGGTVQPLGSGQGKMKLDVTDPIKMKERLEDVSLQNFLHVVRTSITKSGYSTNDLNYLAILHMKRSAHNYILSQLQLTEEETNYLSDIGHVGQFDQWISLERGLQQRKIKDGSLVTLVSAGIGYAWAATTVRWGEASV